MPSDTIEKRIFIVGCSRSGTTVLQVSVASHPRITSFPETFFFLHSTGRLGRLPLRLGLASERTRSALQQSLDEIGRSDLNHRIPTSWRYRPYVDTYLDILDEQALDAGADLWVEKTPMHVHRLGLILQYVPDAHVIHMVRDGRDVVGSICYRAREYGGIFEDQEDPSVAVSRWNRALKASVRYLGQPKHSLVLYEQFVRDPGRSMRRVCRELGISYDARMAQGTDEAAEAVIPDEKDWIRGAKEPPKEKESKFERLFSAAEQRDIEEALDFSLHDRIKNEVDGA
jgi:hypothetical protein